MTSIDFGIYLQQGRYSSYGPYRIVTSGSFFCQHDTHKPIVYGSNAQGEELDSEIKIQLDKIKIIKTQEVKRPPRKSHHS